MAEQITQEITALPEAPKEGVGFRARAAAFFGALVTFASQLAAWRTQVNAVADWINSMSWHVETQVSMADGAKSSAVTAAMQSANSADRASVSEANALAFKNAASDSATAAATAQANAVNYALSASNSATAAANSAATATAKATSATTSATNAATSENNALTSKNAATTSANNAATSEANALASKNAAATSATAAATSEANAATLATAAATSEASVAAGLAAIKSNTSYYLADIKWGVASSNRYTIKPPNNFVLNFYGALRSVVNPGMRSLDLSSIGTWGGPSAFTSGASRAGKDFYIYAIYTGGAMDFRISADATYPSGFSYATSRLIGGFHCLCADIGVISGHPLSGYLAGDILPASVWDLLHRPVCSPEGMVYVEGLGKWVDIYLASVSGGALVSVLGGTIADGGSTPAFHWYKFSQWFGQIGKRLPTQHDFVALSLGSNQGTNIAGGTDPVTTGGHVDTAGRRMVSNVGCEDCCGVLWQWGAEPGGGAASAAWANAFDGNDAGVAGKSYQAPNRALLGGGWSDGAYCGSRGSSWSFGPLNLYVFIGARGVAEPLAV